MIRPLKMLEEHKNKNFEAEINNILLKDKLKPYLTFLEKLKIFCTGYGQDILLRDKEAPELCVYWVVFKNLRKREYRYEPFIVKNPNAITIYLTFLDEEHKQSFITDYADLVEYYNIHYE